MYNHSQDQGVEAGTLLCDLSFLFLDTIAVAATGGSAVQAGHQVLITSRMLSTLVVLWVSWVTIELEKKRNNVDTSNSPLLPGVLRYCLSAAN